jgi:hypothetical protein
MKRNLLHQLRTAGATVLDITSMSGQYLVTVSSDAEKVRAVLPRVFGLANFG